MGQFVQMSASFSSTAVSALVGYLKPRDSVAAAPLSSVLPKETLADPAATAQALEEMVRRAIDSGLFHEPQRLVERLQGGADPLPTLELLARNTAALRVEDEPATEDGGHPASFTFAPADRQTLVLTETPPAGWIATYRGLVERQLRFALNPSRLGATGTMTIPGRGTIKVELHLGRQELTVQLNGKPHFSYEWSGSGPSTSPFLERVAAQADEVRRDTAKRVRATASPEVAAAFDVIERMRAGSNLKCDALLDLIADHPEAAREAAASLPLIYAWIASDENPSGLRDNVSVIMDTPLPPVVRAILERAAKADGLVLTAGVHAAIVAMTDLARVSDTKAPVDFELWLEGARLTLHRLLREDGIRHQTLATTWKSILGILQETLPVGHPARTRLADAVRDGVRELPIDTARTYVLALGDACHFIDHGKFPEVSAEMPGRDVMPLLAMYSLDRPITVTELHGPTGASNATWRDVRQAKLGNCYFGAGCGEVAFARPGDIANVVTMFNIQAEGSTATTRSARVRFCVPGHDNDVAKVDLWIDTRVYTERNGDTVYGRSREALPAAEARNWFALIEKAFALIRKDKGRYGDLVAGSSAETFKLFYGNVYVAQVQMRHVSGAQLEQDIVTALRGRLPLTICTGADDHANSKLFASHVYMISGIERSDEGVRVRLINMHADREPPKPTFFNMVWEEFVKKDGPVYKPAGEFEMTLDELRRDADRLTFVNLPPMVDEESMARVKGYD